MSRIYDFFIKKYSEFNFLNIAIYYRKKKHLSSSQTDLSSNSIGVNANRGEAIPQNRHKVT